MNYRNILKVYKLERDLSDDETALLNTLRGMTEAERELVAETLQPEKVVKAATKERKIEKCALDKPGTVTGTCNLTRRAMVHQVPSAEGFHEFQAPQPATKSRRASSLKEKIQGTAASKLKSNGDDDLHCTAIIGGTSNTVCGLHPDHALHQDKTYIDYHPFVAPSTTAPPATRPSAANGGGESGGVSSEIGRETAGSAVHTQSGSD